MRIEHSHGIRPHVRRIHSRAIRIGRERIRLRAKVALPRQPCIEIPAHRKLRIRTLTNLHRGHSIAIRQCHIQQPFALLQQQRARMRSRIDRRVRLQQRDLARHLPASQIELCDFARIPQRHKSPLAILRNRKRNRIRRRHRIALGKIE